MGVSGTLFTAATTAIVTVLWSMNASIATLNEKVGEVANSNKEFKVLVTLQIDDLSHRLRRVEENRQEKTRH